MTTPLVRSRFAALALGLAAALAACHSERITRDDHTSYSLSRVDGHALPAEYNCGGGGLVQGGTLVLGPGHTAKRIIHYAGTELLAPSTQTMVGTYETDGSTVSLTLHPDTPIYEFVWLVEGERSGNTLTLRYTAPCDGTTEELFHVRTSFE